MNIFRTIIIPATIAPLARELAAGLSPGGVGMFIVPLYDATNTIVYYISSGWIDVEFDALLADADLLFAACGGAATLEQCQALVSQSVVVDADTETALATVARLGLSISEVTL